MYSLQRREWLRKTLAALGALGLGRLALRAGEPGKTFSDDFMPDWEVQKEYTLEVAEAMPAEKYDFKPTPEMRSFGELMVHIGGAVYGFSASLREEQQRPAGSQAPEEPAKQNVVPYLKGAFDYAAEGIAALDDTAANETVSLFGGRLSMTRAKLCHFMRDHTTHHRGYGLPYLRLNGVQPPRYRFGGTRPSPV